MIKPVFIPPPPRLAGFYFLHYVVKRDYPLLPLVGLILLTLGMLIDELPIIYIVANCVAICAIIYVMARPP